MTEQPTKPVDPEMLEFDLPDRLRRSLRIADMQGQDMAEYLGVRRETVSTWLMGHINPRKQTLRLWALRTGVPLEWLETGQRPDVVRPAAAADTLPRLDSNQQPSGYLSVQVSSLSSAA